MQFVVSAPLQEKQLGWQALQTISPLTLLIKNPYGGHTSQIPNELSYPSELQLMQSVCRGPVQVAHVEWHLFDLNEN